MVTEKNITYISSVFALLIQVLLAVTLIATPVQAQTPAGWWKFDDGSGTSATDSSGNGHTATLVNGITWATGKIGGAVSANAANRQYVSIPKINLSGSNAVTVALWANRTYSTAGGHTLFEATTNYSNSTTGFAFLPDDTTCAGIQAALRGNLGYVANCYSQPSSGVWHHLAVVFDKSQTGGDEVKFYVDGVLQTINRSLYASTNTNNFGNNPLYLFARAGTTQFNSGLIDDLRIYNSALTAQQIQRIYNNSELVSIAVTPTNPSIPAGKQQPFTATGTYSDGSKKDLTSSAIWTSSAPAVATISSGGLATGAGAGNTTIQATSGSINGSTTLTVTAATNFTISASPSSLSVVQGNQGTSTITTTISGGFSSSIALSASGMPSGTTVSFNPQTIPAPGSGNPTMTITVGSSTPVGTYPITVTGNGGGIQQNAALTLTVTATTISYVQGNYANPDSPQTTVSVMFNAAQSAADLNVVVVGWGDSTAVVKSVADKSGNTYTLAVGPTIVRGQLSQSIYYAKNIAAAAGANTVTVTFASAAAYPDIRILEYSGADPNNPLDVTAANAGNSATSSSGSATTTNPTDLLLGANIVGTYTNGPGSGFTQRLLTHDGNLAEDRMVTTTGSYSATAPLSSSCPWIMQLVAFRTPGSPVLVSIAVTPANPSIAAGNQQPFTATGTYSDGSHQDLTSSATWTSSVPTVATINSSGLATGVAIGSTMIQAASGSINGSTGLTVTALTLVSVSVTPVNPSMAAGKQQQFTATGTYSDGSHQDLTNSATWTSSAPSVATINSTGLATGVAIGSTTIQAASGSINGSTGLTVTASAPGSYTTNFPLTENPISEDGNWTNGGCCGNSSLWGNIQTTPGEVFGVSEPTTYGDPTAIVNGTWGSNQTITVTVKITSQPTSCCHELELRPLTTISTNSITGYEINCSTVTGDPYIQLVRWNGTNGNYTQLDQLVPAQPCKNGDVLVGTTTVSGGTVTFGLTVNGVQQVFTNCHCTNPSDSGAGAFLTGSPGIGFYDNQDSNWNYFGFSSFTAKTD